MAGRERDETVCYPIFVCCASTAPDIIYCSRKEY